MIRFEEAASHVAKFQTFSNSKIVYFRSLCAGTLIRAFVMQWVFWITLFWIDFPGSGQRRICQVCRDATRKIIG